MRERAERLGLSVVERSHRFDESGDLIEPEPATRPDQGHHRPSRRASGAAARRSARSAAARRARPAEWIGPRPERIVGWAFALGLLLILIAITTADAATV